MTISENLVIQHKNGLHARPAALLIQTAKEYQSTIEVVFKKKKGNAKSLLSILGLGVKYMDTVTISARGLDEVSAITAIRNLIENKFFEI